MPVPKKMLPWLAAVLLCSQPVTANADVPPDLPPNFSIPGGLALLATAAFACHQRDQSWMMDLIKDTQRGAETLLQGQFGSAVPPSVAADAMVYLASQAALGTVVNQSDCDGLASSGLLTAGDQAVAHQRGN